MKKLLLSLLILVCCCLLFAACANAEITTEKSGKIAVSVYPASDGKAVLTPTAKAAQHSATDDAKGLYRLTCSKTGEGEVSLSSEKAQAGTPITVTATPASKWKLTNITVNGQSLGEGVISFDMPANDANVVVTFEERRHYLFCGEYVAASADRAEGHFSAYEVLEGDRIYFTVDYEDADHYYEDEDVKCRYYDDENGVSVLAPVRKESAGRYSVVAPDKDLYASVNIHSYRSLIGKVDVFTSDYGWGIYSEVDYTEQCIVAITANGSPYTMGDKVKDGTEFRVHLTVPFAYRVKRVYGIGSNFTPDDENADEFTFVLDQSKNFEVTNVSLRIEIGKMYAVTCVQNKFGGVTAEKTVVMKGEYAVITTDPLRNYTMDSLRYTTDGEHYEGMEEIGDGRYCFVMPDGDVTVVGTFSDHNTPADCVRGTLVVKYAGGEVSPNDLFENVRFDSQSVALTPLGVLYLSKDGYHEFSMEKTEAYLKNAVSGSTDPEEVLDELWYGDIVYGSLYVGEEDFIFTIEFLE